MSFHRKILISLITVFILLLVALSLFIPLIIPQIQKKHFLNRSRQFIENVKSTSNLSELKNQINEKQNRSFFKISIYSSSGELLYSTEDRSQSLNQDVFSLPEMQLAKTEGEGFNIRFSPYYDQEMAYVAKQVSFQRDSLFFHLIYPYGEVASLNKEFSTTLLILSLLILCFLILFVGATIHHFTQPVRTILRAIKPFQLGQQEHIPEIDLGKNISRKDEFGQLAETLNALSKRILNQISTLTLERNERAAILESLVEGVVAIDHDLRVTYINHMAEVFLKIRREEVLGKELDSLSITQFNQILSDAMDKGHLLQQTLRTETKPRKFFDVIAVPRGRNGAILVLQDTTNLHKVIELGRDFIANASHELKTPITIIRGFAETLHDHPELSPEIYREITQKIVSNCQRMDTLIKNLLTLAAVDEGIPASRLQECNLIDLVGEAIQTIHSVHPQANIQLEADQTKPFYLLADGDLLRQAILNLLDNAVKYSKPPGQITVWLSKKEDEIIIKVADQGIGIPQEDLDRVFERFYAVDKSHSRSMGGSGLGLSIVERIVEKHKGKILVESTLGVGTTFTIIFPIMETEDY